MNKYQAYSKVTETKKALWMFNSCENKRRFKTFEEAITFRDGGPQKAYFCKICLGYHRSGALNSLFRKVHRLNKHKNN